MADFKECSRRGRFIDTDTCECFSNRIIHPREGYANAKTCEICPFKNQEDDPDLPPYSEQKHPDSQQQLPSVATLGKNFLKAIVMHAANGVKKVSKEEFKERLEQCNKCVFHKDNRCSHMNCGCFITKKAKWKSEDCPIGRWRKDE